MYCVIYVLCIVIFMLWVFQKWVWKLLTKWSRPPQAPQTKEVLIHFSRLYLETGAFGFFTLFVYIWEEPLVSFFRSFKKVDLVHSKNYGQFFIYFVRFLRKRSPVVLFVKKNCSISKIIRSVNKGSFFSKVWPTIVHENVRSFWKFLFVQKNDAYL